MSITTPDTIFYGYIFPVCMAIILICITLILVIGLIAIIVESIKEEKEAV